MYFNPSSPTFGLWLNNVMGRKRYIHTKINQRAKDHEAIAGWTSKGFTHIYVYTWQRDCDCAEWSMATKVEPTYEAYILFQDMIYRGAEGPVSMHIMSPTEYVAFKPRTRDRVLEAFENGSSYNV